MTIDITAAVDAVLDDHWGEGESRPWAAHRNHNHNSSCAVCSRDITAVLTVALPHLDAAARADERAKAIAELRAASEHVTLHEGQRTGAYIYLLAAKLLAGEIQLNPPPQPPPPIDVTYAGGDFTRQRIGVWIDGATPAGGPEATPQVLLYDPDTGQVIPRAASWPEPDPPRAAPVDWSAYGRCPTCWTSAAHPCFGAGGVCRQPHPDRPQTTAPGQPGDNT